MAQKKTFLMSFWKKCAISKIWKLKGVSFYHFPGKGNENINLVARALKKKTHFCNVFGKSLIQWQPTHAAVAAAPSASRVIYLWAFFLRHTVIQPLTPAVGEITLPPFIFRFSRFWFGFWFCRCFLYSLPSKHLEWFQISLLEFQTGVIPCLYATIFCD